MRKAALFILLPLLALAAVAVLISMRGFEQADSAPMPRENTQGTPRYTVSNADWTRIGADGKTEFHVIAERIDYYDDESARLQNMTMDGLVQGKGPWRLTSPLGQMPAHQQRIQLNQPVVMTGALKNGETMKITTTQLWVDAAKKQLYTDALVVLTRGTQQASATGMTADWAGQRLQLLHDVKVTYVPKG